MELRQLRSLVTLADERHFTRAAALLHIAQPALSQQIRRLEDELGIALVDRTTRHVALTPAGARLAARARRALAEVDAAAAELSELAGIRSGRVVIGAMRSTGPFDLSALLAAFHSRHPGVELLVREEPSEVMLQRLHADALDVAFLAVNRQKGDVERVGVQALEHHLAGLLAHEQLHARVAGVERRQQRR